MRFVIRLIVNVIINTIAIWVAAALVEGINLTGVDMIAIGLGSQGGAAVGGTGTMYIDDIRLCRVEP